MFPVRGIQKDTRTNKLPIKAQTMNEYYISTDKSYLDEERIFILLNDCFWSKNIPANYITRFIKFSLCFGVYLKNSNELVGFGRVISDYTTYAYICDVVIDPSHRQRGLGNALIKAIISHPDLQGLKTWALRTTEDARKIYEKYGFKLACNPETQYEINDLDIYSSPSFKNIHKQLKHDLKE